MYLRRIPWLAMVLIVVLRVAIGWQLFYEGLWKTKTLSSPRPWTSEGYLKNSQGPMRTTFRNMTGDPNDFGWLNADRVTAKWKKWQAEFARHYQLTDRQRGRLKNLVEGPDAFYSDKDALTELPAGVDLDAVSVISFDAENGRLKVDGKKHLSGKEYTKILKMLPPVKEAESGDADEKDGEKEPEEIAIFRTQLGKVYERSLRLSYIEQLRATLIGDADVAGVTNRDGDRQQMGELEKYREMILDYEKLLASAKQDFQHEHLKKSWSELQQQRASLVNPIRALDASLKEDAEKLVTVDQMQRSGKPPEPWTGLRIADAITILGLTLCGFCLIIGLFTRFSALMAAIMLFSFYLAMPPLPGLPEAPGPEHSLIVNKNLIEVFALLALATLPSGYWFGLDKFATKIWRKITGKEKPSEDD